MTEFITRNYGNKEFEVIIKTDNNEHYEASQDFARMLIGHGKNMTNADRLRAMSDREIAEFLAGRFTDRTTDILGIDSKIRTATDIHAEAAAWFAFWMKWLRTPVEE